MRLYHWVLIIICFATLPFQAYAETPEQQFVRNVTDEVIDSIKAGGSGQRVSDALESVFNNYIDIDWVGRFVLGRHWRSANDQQKTDFTRNYRDFMVSRYTERLQEYSGETYELSEARDLGKERSVLTMKVIRPGGQPILIDYKIRKKQETYKIYDIVVEGISLIATQRSEFDSVINRNGLDYLINALGKKARS